MYLGSALIGFAIFNVLLWFLCLSQANTYIQYGIGDADNYRRILTCIPIFGFMFPMLLGIRTLRRAGRAMHERTGNAK